MPETVKFNASQIPAKLGERLKCVSPSIEDLKNLIRIPSPTYIREKQKSRNRKVPQLNICRKKIYSFISVT
jgi:hypothetical protein